MRIWIDADATPREVKEIVFRAAKRLPIRDLMEGARMAGVITGGPPPFDARAKQAFAGALDRALTRLLRVQ